ncbi:MAG: isoprenylcysteine carboxylmethyltransferase family protein [Candidatus Spechtbacteria bacterium SB0662_bin_43]|uniref:Isoprenylcysteine carboxylmethyltransferase family protein n=1 Tax=Candidatus Spechtbacteria bacterium SB0662_bin_43 TaxID=2604897 RepID=A0A845D9F3_9BACT|nr:isoprenylcysteine carboxylmethyltransferase family protein [Candidatus Spechtbacteria bacterium SB0662_bin_43]
MGRAHDHHSGAMAGGESDSMSDSVADKERNSVINTVLIAYVIVFLLSIIFLVVSVKKKTGVFPIARNTRGVYGFVDKVVLLSYVLVIGNVVLYVMNEVSVYEFADILAVKIAGVVVAGIGLVCMFIAQRQMGKNWRIGIDQEHTTDIVDTGLFRCARHPIYLFAVVITIGMILVIPSISSIAILVLLWVALSVQARLEEEFFLEKHGEPYQRFMETRKRWFS